MKKALLLVLALVFVKPGFTDNVKPEVARTVAETFLTGYGAKTTQMVDISNKAGFANLYVFSTESSFVVVAKDDRVQPILGYSLTDKFITEDMPDHVKWWIQCYSDQIQYVKDNNLNSDASIDQSWASLTSGHLDRGISYVVVSPLISTTWDQNYPYNYYCPQDSNGPGGRVYAGCVACAMAQVMKFWEYPTQGSGSHSYTPASYSQQSVNFGSTTYQWANMPASISSTSSQTNIDAIATLMYHCGVAVDMDYGYDGSGAQSTKVETALKDYFRFAPTTRYVSSSSYSSEEWIALLKSELDEGRPLYYSGSNENSGHAFVCDGYRSDNYFHFNWGWSGSHDNYWAIGALNPGSGGSGSGSGTYNMYNAIIAGAEPISSLSAPTISASTANGEITLSWNAVSGASSYDIYKDNVKIVTNYSNTSFTDDEVDFGTTYQYFVRSKSNTATSNPSNTVSIRSTYRETAPSNLTATNAANGVSLHWTGYTGNNSAQLYYGIESNGWRWGSEGTDENYWGQRYTPSQLEPYGGMSINKVSVYIGETGSYTMYLYKTNTSSTSNRLAQQSFTASSTGWYDVTLSSSIALDVTKDLWVVFHIGTEASYPACISNYSGEGAEFAHYFSNSLTNLPNETADFNDGNMSWLIKTSVTDGTYTYNVYRDGARVASQVNGTSYTDTHVTEGYHTYYVKTNCGGIESEASNEVGLDATGGTPLPEDVLIYEPFEEYTVFNKIAVESQAAGHSWWTTWNSLPGSSEDGVVYELNGTKCARFTYGNDQVILLGDVDNGSYDLEFDVYVPEGKNGYFNILHNFAGPNSTWAMESYLHMSGSGTSSPGTGAILAGSTTATAFSMVYDEWMHFRLHVDTDNDLAEYYYTAPGGSEEMIKSWQWSLNAAGSATVGRKLAAMNFYPPLNASTSDFYVDNFKLTKVSGETAPNISVTPSSVTEELGVDDMTSVDITIENSGNSIGEWIGWIDFGMGGSGSQNSELAYHSGEVGTGIGSTNAFTREMAIRLPATAYDSAAMGMRIVSAQFFITETYQSADNNYIFRIYGQGMNNQPGQLLAEKTVNSSATGQWITATFDTSVYMTGQTIWATVQLEQAGGEYPLSMDGGAYGETSDGNWLSTNGGSFSHCYSADSFEGAWMITVNCSGELIPATWASINKSDGSIMGGTNETVTLSLNTSGLSQLHQEATLIINTNDNIHPHFEIPVVLNLNELERRITTVVSPLDGGTVSGSGYYDLGETCTLTATPNTGYSFQKWTENDVEVSIDSVYSFTVTENRTLTAVFELSEPSISTLGELGYTTYDWQSNDGAITRTIKWPDGKVSFAWTTASNTSYSDRGTGIATYDPTTNGWIASQGRVESEKTGFGSIARYGTNGIVIAAHTPNNCGIYIVPDKDNIPTNSVAATCYLDNTYYPSWPNVMTSGANRNIIHVIACASSTTTTSTGLSYQPYYFRSQDGGLTWDKENVVLPYLGADDCGGWESNKLYWMETTDENCLALVVNNPWNNGMVLYSYDDGETWQRKEFYQHPGQFNSYDNWFFFPRWTSCQWDNNHKLHVLYEFNGTSGDVGSGSFYPGIGGVAYWNETLPYNQNGTTQSAIDGNLTPGQPFVIDTAYLRNDIYSSWWIWSDASHEMWPEYVGYLPPLTDDGDWEDPYSATEFNIQDRSLHGSYNSGVCAFPVLCRVNNTDDLVAVWCAMDENHTDGNGNYYYKVFASYSNDSGSHWTNMVQLTKDPQFANMECVYLQAAVVNNNLVVAFQMDGETGTYVQGDDGDAFDNRYQGLSFDLHELFGDIPNYVYITATVNPTEGGHVVGTGSYTLGSQCTLNAVANPGYLFENWTKDDVVVSTEPTYSFTVTEAASFIAHFTVDTGTYTVTVLCDPEEGGTVTGAGSFVCNNTCTLTATPNSGYYFLNWTENSVVVSTDSVYSFTVTGNRTLTAVFTDTPPQIPNSNAVMTTYYDLQSNSYVANRMYQLPDGSVGVVATMSHQANQSASDRGTGYNFYKNGQWQDQPDERIESFKTGWPSIAQWGSSGEILVCHGNGHLQCFTREVAGEGEWVYMGNLPDHPSEYPYDDYPRWPRVVTSGDNHNVIHVVAGVQHSDSETITYQVYYRSTDGSNWEVSYSPLADLGYESGFFSADDYALAANGHNVALLYSGSLTNSVWMFKSTNDGVTWTPTKVWEDPYEGISLSDPGLAYSDTLYRPMNGSIVIDNDGVVHVALNTFEMAHWSDFDSGTYAYWLGRTADGILYWNDTQEAPIQSPDGNPHHAARLWWPDEDNSGYVGMQDDPSKWIGYIPMETGYYWENDRFYHSDIEYFSKFYGASGHPALSCDPYGNLACAYSAPSVKYEDYQNHYYRHIYVSYRNAEDGYWRQAEDDITDPVENPEFSETENLFTISVPNTVNQGEFWFGFQSDSDIGFYWGGNASQSSATENGIYVVKLEKDVTNTGYYISATANPVGSGVVTGAGVFQDGQQCTLNAVANQGYLFENWTKEDMIVSTEPSYSFTVTEAASFVANFIADTTTTVVKYAITATANPAQGGSVIVSDGNGFPMTFYFGFDDSTMEGWTQIDADGDGYGWEIGSNTLPGAYGHNSSDDFVTSASYKSGVGALHPDNYLVSPQIPLGGSITFYSCAQDASWAAEHFGVAVSTTGNIDPANFTTIQEWTMTSGRAQGAWFEYTVDLSAYGGQTGYVAIRHFNCSDQFYLNIDDITITRGTEFVEGQTCVLTATANEGYSFNDWTKDNTQVSIDSVYSFTVMESGDYVANFEPKPYEITLAVDPIEGGTVTGAGTYLYNTTCVLTASANTGYYFSHWTKNGVVVSMDATINVTVTGNATYVAHYRIPLQPDGNNIVYVRPNGGGTKNGSSWENATDDLALALDYLSKTNIKPNVWVAAGTYYGDSVADHNAFTLVNGVNVYGGFVGNEPAYYDLSLRNIVANQTILDGQNVQRVVYQGNHFSTSTYIDGFTIRNGSLNYEMIQGSCTGAGVRLMGNTYLKNCTIKDNSIVDNEYYNSGGAGVYAEGLSSYRVHVQNCYVTNNIITSNTNHGHHGSGVYGYYADIENCSITGNDCSGVILGGGVYGENSTINSCIISNNYCSSNGGGLCLVWSTAINCLISNNTCPIGGGVETDQSYLYNCDIVNNSANGRLYSALYCVNTNHIYNCIIWGNTNGYYTIYDQSSGTEFAYCAIEGGYDGTGNINLASDNDGTGALNYVRFVDVENSDFQLQYNSACVDAGDPDYSPSDPLDLAGNPRIHNGRVDIGCYEFTGVIESNISDEICYGEDYVLNGFNIVHPAEGTSTHSILIPLSQGLDSLVNLTLTVNPVYFTEVDTTVCDMSSFSWHGHVYTTSGVYYDTLPTVHGCDSVFELTLHLYNTPLGDFSNMLPTGNSSVNTWPVAFYWDAVAGATKYDLYLWDSESLMPSHPTASNLSYCYYNTSALQNNRTYNWLVVAKNPCYEKTSDVQSFVLEVTPALNVNMASIDFGEVSMNSSVTRNMRVTGVVLEDTLSVQITGADAAMFSYVKASGWDNYNGGILRVTFNPTVPQYNYDAELIVSCGSLSQTTTLTGAVSDLFGFTTYVPEDVYSMNTSIPIYGSLVDWNSAPVPDVEVEIAVFVMGTKRTLPAITDANGEFMAWFEPMPFESGYYTVNSGRPGHNSTAVHDEFNIPGMAVATTDNILCTVTQDEPKTDSILIRNKSNVPLTNIQVTTLSAPNGCTVSASPFNLGGLQEGYLVYTVVGTETTSGTYYEQLRIKATSDEGAETVIPIWYYCEEAKGLLEAIPGTLTTTVVEGKTKVVDVMLVNNGDTETGKLTLSPNEFAYWISPVGGDTMPSIAPHDTAYVSMRFALGYDFAPNPEPYVASQYILSERGDDVTFLIYFTVVDDPTGSIVIDVTDDFTWNGTRTDEPHVGNAEVVVKGYHSLELIGNGFTNSQGLFQLDDLEEGYYRVTVTADDHHTEYEGIINVHGGENTPKTVYLQYLPVVYSWNASPTGEPNEYTYDLVIDYETNVPVPVITIEHAGIHDLEYGESDNFSITVINHGLIGAYDTHLNFSESSEYVFVPLYDIIDTIAPNDTIVIPGVYYRSINQSMYSNADCDVHITAISMYHTNSNETGQTLIQNRSLPFELGNYSTCQPSANSLCNGIPSYNYSPDAPFSSYYVDDGNNGGGFIVEEQFQTPCVEALLSVLDDCVPHDIPDSPMMTSLSGATTIIANEGPVGTEQMLLNHLSSFASQALSIVGGGLWGIKDCLWNVYDGLDVCSTRSGGLFQTTLNELSQSSFYYYNEFMFVKSIFANDAWNDEENVVAFVDAFKSLINPSSGLVSNSDAIDLATSFIGTSADYDDIIGFAERWNRSVEYWSNNYFMISDLPSGYNPDFIQIDNALINSMVNIENYYASEGYMGMRNVYTEAVDNGFALKAQGSKLYTSVRMQLSQIGAMACESYHETFTIHNGHDAAPITQIGLDFVVKDAQGNDCTNLFQISTTLQQITGIDGSGTVDPGLDGTVKIQCIPSRQAAQNGEKAYYCGGTLSFVDPYTSIPIVHELYSAAITITPGPDLYVDYFMPRYIIADDTATVGKIERSEIAELGVIIHNKGGRIAENVTLETAKPTINNYWDGNDNHFALKNVMFNGALRQLGLMEIPFGNIDTTQTSVGEWRFLAKQLGVFEDYHANVIHNSSYGNSDLSLVSHMGLHELVHPIYAYGNLDDGINDFLINGDFDINGIPDSIYFSQGGTTVVDMVDNITFDHYVEPLDTIVILTVNPSRVGWNYGVTDDPGRDKYELKSCTRNVDNQEIPLNNVWQTFVSIVDDPNPVYENKLHIVDTLSNASMDYTYTLVYCLREDLLDIVEITGIPQTDIDHPQQSFTVQFNKKVIDTTFTYEDMSLTCNNGANLLDSSVVITMIDSMNFEVNISSFTNNPGLYELTVSTMHIKDNVGYEGYNAKQVTWNQVWSDYTQTDDLTAGWNWWSTFVDMSTEQDFDKLKIALGDNASMIKSRNNGFVSYYGGWYGSLTSLNNSEMYMINMNNDYEISITGPLADVTNSVVDINPGWNWIGYPLHGDQNINDALANLQATENDMLKSRNAFASYYPSLGWVGSLTNLIPGEGYMYSSNGSAPTSFTYVAPSKVVRHPKEKGTNHWEMSVGKYEMNATITGVIHVNGEELRDDMLVVGAFIDDRCVGQTQVLYVEGVDRYLVFLTYFGTENDKIEFRLYDEGTGIEYGPSETTALFAANSILGTVEEPFVIDFITLGVDESYIKTAKLLPNPVDSKEKVWVTLDEGLTAGMQVEVLSSLGVQLYKTIATGDVVELTAPLIPGVYFIKITNNEDIVCYGKLIVK